VARDAANEPFAVGSQVAHAEWGVGQVVRYEGDKIVVLFDLVGYKNLALDIVLGRGLLAAAKAQAR
jgi:ATP-dependent DNA helicase RecQ